MKSSLISRFLSIDNNNFLHIQFYIQKHINQIQHKKHIHKTQFQNNSIELFSGRRLIRTRIIREARFNRQNEIFSYNFTTAQ